jgi:hypothetical protein
MASSPRGRCHQQQGGRQPSPARCSSPKRQPQLEPAIRERLRLIVSLVPRASSSIVPLSPAFILGSTATANGQRQRIRAGSPYVPAHSPARPRGGLQFFNKEIACLLPYAIAAVSAVPNLPSRPTAPRRGREAACFKEGRKSRNDEDDKFSLPTGSSLIEERWPRAVS